jgi:CBS domain-containing protein
MKNDEPITRIMTEKVVAVKVNSSLPDAEKLMRRKKIRHVPVLSGEKLVGIVSLTDLQRLSFADNYGDEEAFVDTAIYSMLSIDQVMVANPVTVRSDQSIREVAEVLSNHEFHALPVVDGENRLVGIVTTTDLIRYMLDLLKSGEK